MLQFMRQQKLKVQTLFWMTIIAVLSFSVLFGFNYIHYRERLISIHNNLINGVSELVSMSSTFFAADNFFNGDINMTEMSTLLNFKNDVVEKSNVDAIYIFCLSEGEIYLIKSVKDFKVNPQDENIPSKVLDTCKKVVFIGTPETVLVDAVDYCINPVLITAKNKYAVCVVKSYDDIKNALLRYALFNVGTFILVLVTMLIFLVFAVERVIIKPLVNVVKIVDTFVYQVGGGRTVFMYRKFNESELVSLTKSVKRLEEMVIHHRNMVKESEQYRKWLKDKALPNMSAIDYLSQAERFNEYNSKDDAIWEIKRTELDHLPEYDAIDFLYMVYLRFPDENVDLHVLLKDLEKVEGVKGIPVETIYRLTPTDFVFIFARKRLMDVIQLYIDEFRKDVKIGCAVMIPSRHHSIAEMIQDCLAQIEKVEELELLDKRRKSLEK